MQLPPHARIIAALFPPAHVQQQIDRQGRAWQWPADRWWTELHRLHLTLIDPFDATPGEVEALHRELDRVRFGPLELRFKSVDCRGATAVLLPERHAGLEALRKEVRLAALRAGLRVHVPQAHVTVSRQAQGMRLPPLAVPIHWQACSFSLVWSQLHPAFPKRHYEILQTYSASRQVDLVPAPAAAPPAGQLSLFDLS